MFSWNIIDNVVEEIVDDNYIKDEHEIDKELQAILTNKSITAVFQPIVSLLDGDIFGYEALSRGIPGSKLAKPDALFAAAEKYDKVWELEFLCRSKAFAKAHELPTDKMLFINVDPKIIKDTRFQKGVTLEMLTQYNIDASNIIFEITEKSSIEDYKNFRRVLDNYTSQGYKIAIDDAGAGYSGLKSVAEIRPQFIKIDMDLVRDIDKDVLKQALLKAFYEFSVSTNMKIIAEGIETIDELETLIHIGIPYGQGYLLQRPAVEFLEIDPNVKNHIIMSNLQKKQETFYTPLTMPIGDICRQDQGFSSNLSCSQILDYFNENPNIMGLPILQGDYPIGMVMKNKLVTYFSTQYGASVYKSRPIRLIMDQHFLVVDYETPLEQVSYLAITRTEDKVYDYIVITKQEKYYGIITVRCLLEKTTHLEINRAKHSNPLSGLPSKIIIEEKLKQVMKEQDPHVVLYFDLDHFKVYNNAYGFDNGDKILYMIAQAIQYEFKKNNISNPFIGHIGGDHFIAIVKDINDAEIIRICEAIIRYFDGRIGDFYTEEDKKAGYVMIKNRQDVEERVPLLSICIAVVKSIGSRFKYPTDLAEAASAIKKQYKLPCQSRYCIE